MGMRCLLFQVILKAYQEVAVMYALGHKRTFAMQKALSALPPKADIGTAQIHVCKGPEADITALFNDVVGSH